MEKVRAFKGQDAPLQKLIINEQVLHHIKDVAHKLVMDDKREFNLHRTMYTALHILLTQSGIEPGFEVKL